MNNPPNLNNEAETMRASNPNPNQDLGQEGPPLGQPLGQEGQQALGQPLGQPPPLGQQAPPPSLTEILTGSTNKSSLFSSSNEGEDLRTGDIITKLQEYYRLDNEDKQLREQAGRITEIKTKKTNLLQEIRKQLTDLEREDQAPSILFAPVRGLSQIGLKVRENIRDEYKYLFPGSPAAKAEPVPEKGGKKKTVKNMKNVKNVKKGGRKKNTVKRERVRKVGMKGAWLPNTSTRKKEDSIIV